MNKVRAGCDGLFARTVPITMRLLAVESELLLPVKPWRSPESVWRTIRVTAADLLLS